MSWQTANVDRGIEREHFRALARWEAEQDRLEAEHDAREAAEIAHDREHADER